MNTDGQDFIKGVLDTVVVYKHNRLNWDNSLFMEYGKTTLRPYDAPKTTNENADKILAASDLSYACWDFNSFKLGPMARLSYETEFEPADGTDDRLKIARAFGGLSIFDSKIIKSLHLAAVYEYDFTYGHDQVSKLATDGYYREYLDYSQYVGTDLERDLNMTARMDTNLWGAFTMGPYLQYRLAKARDAEHYGSNLTIGISFNYITKFGLR